MLRPLRFAQDGAERVHAALSERELGRLESVLASTDIGKPGARLGDELASVADLLGLDGAVGCIAVRLGGGSARPVRAILFDKSSDGNWSLGLHQDRTIAVRRRRDVPGFGPWTIKAGRVHVEPPFEIIARMVTLRVHLDAVDDHNAPLLVIPGSHGRGRIPEPVLATLDANAAVPCHAERGDIWAYSTPVVHGSGPVRAPGRRRRVLQLDYAFDALPGGLQWAGVGEHVVEEFRQP